VSIVVGMIFAGGEPSSSGPLRCFGLALTPDGHGLAATIGKEYSRHASAGTPVAADCHSLSERADIPLLGFARSSAK